MYTYEQMISELGEIPYCQCNCGNKVHIYSDKNGSYSHYRKSGYPKFIQGHSSRCMSQETKNKLKEKRSKQIPPMLGKKNIGLSEFMKLKNPMFVPEVIEKHSGKNNWMTTPEGRLWASERIKGDLNPSKKSEVAAKVSEGNKKYIENHPKVKQEKSELFKNMWKDPEFRILHSGDNHYRYNGGIKEYCRRKLIRRKQLGFYSLNPIIGNGYRIIRGFERHHVNENDVIYVPKNYNQGIKHNLKQNFNMEIVNTMAYFFLIMNYIEDLNKLFTTYKKI